MPKVIKDAEKTIKNCATELFVEYGYLKVDIRMISAKSKIAVGTLYHYYQSKKQLYFEILNESWEKTFIKLDTISIDDIPSEEKLRKYIIVLYEDMEQRKGLGKFIFDDSLEELKDDIQFNDLKKRMFFKVENVLKGFQKTEVLNKCAEIDFKLAMTLLVSITVMQVYYTKEKTENIIKLDLVQY